VALTSALRRLRRSQRNPEGRMSVLDHLRELRRRLVLALLFVIAGAILGWFFYGHILDVLRHPYCSVPAKYRYTPLGTQKCVLIYHGVLDGFTTRLKVSVIAGAVLTAPLWLYQIWGFITPGLRRKERRYTVGFIVASTLLFALGVSLAYLVLSKGLRILLEQAGYGTQAQLTVGDYIGFVTLMLVVFGAAFELPLLVVMANLAGVLPATLLRRTQRLAIFLIFVFAAVATPTTDPFTMCAMAAPMVVLYEGAVLYAVVHDRRKARRQETERAQVHLDDDVASEVAAMPEALVETSGWDDTT
jgi:sec-independent protein translocase protein TatC